MLRGEKVAIYYLSKITVILNSILWVPCHRIRLMALLLLELYRESLTHIHRNRSTIFQVTVAKTKQFKWLHKVWHRVSGYTIINKHGDNKTMHTCTRIGTLESVSLNIQYSLNFKCWECIRLGQNTERANNKVTKISSVSSVEENKLRESLLEKGIRPAATWDLVWNKHVYFELIKNWLEHFFPHPLGFCYVITTLRKLECVNKVGFVALIEIFSTKKA